MDNRKFKSGAAVSPPVPEASPSVGYPIDGNAGTGTQATVPGAYAFHSLGEELRNVIVAGGLTPSDASLTQVRDAILQIINNNGAIKTPARAATTANITTLAGGAPNVLDGVNLAANDRVLVKDQTTGSQNGIYVVTTLGTGANGTWTRSGDADGAGEIVAGMMVVVAEGTLSADTLWELTTDGTITVGTTSLSFANKSSPGYMLARDEKANTTDAGGSSSGVQTRVLNTVSANTIPGASLASNQITLPAGKYRIRASCPCENGNLHRAALYNVTNTTYDILGTCGNSTQTATSDAIDSRSWVHGRIVISSQTVYELRHYISQAQATSGLGKGSSSGLGNEVYAEIEIIRE